MPQTDETCLKQICVADDNCKVRSFASCSCVVLIIHGSEAASLAIANSTLDFLGIDPGAEVLVAAWDARRMSLLRPLEFPKRSAGPDFKNQPERARCCLIFTSRKRRSMRRAGELDWCASIYVLVHLAAQLVFSSEMIASHRLTNSDHCSAESAFTSPVLAISALSRLAVAR